MSDTHVDLGCFGCLLEVVGVLGFVYIFTHWYAIWAFATGMAR